MDYITIPIIDAAVRCGIRVGGNTNKIEVSVNCPFCNDHTRHMSLNTVKNVYHCHRCDERGNSITLYAKCMGADNKTAYRELTGGNDYQQGYSNKSESEREPMALTERHSVYDELLQMLELSGKHKNNLLERGLDSSIINRNIYRSVPDKTQAERITEALSRRYDLMCIPGFYTENNKWRMALKEGLFIPVRDKDGYIQGLQIRLDNEQDRKYRWFSSRFKNNGTRAYSWAHVANIGNSKAVYITEGALKADVSAWLSGDCFIGLSGVNCHDGLVPLLNSMGVNRVYEAFDMDKKINKHVAAAATGLRHKLISAGITCESYEWDVKHNGIDDYLLFCQWLDVAA